MLPEQYYPELGALIKGLPQLFKHSEVIGVFLGNELCASFMHNAEQLDKIVFYENFVAIPKLEHQESLKKMYKVWEANVTNLTVALTDGLNFDITADYIHHDMYMAMTEFFDLFKDKLQNSLMSNCGFGCSVPTTLQFAKSIDNRTIFPVLVYRDIVFYTFNEQKKYEVFEIMHSFLESSKLAFIVEIYYAHTNDKIIRLQHVNIYEEQLNESLS